MKSDSNVSKTGQNKKLKKSSSESSFSLGVVESDDLKEIDNNFKTYRLKADFYDQECLDLAKSMLNKYLVRKFELPGGKFALAAGRIVETEAYLGGTSDKASATYNNRQTDRLKALYMTAGTAFVYVTYGMYCCMNISAREPGAGVLIRALEPCYGLDLMRKNRNLAASKSTRELTNGPAKFCMAMSITKEFDQVDLASSESMWLQENLSEQFIQNRTDKNFEIVMAKRIGIDRAGQEAVNKLYRFYIKGNDFVSVKAKEEVV